MKNYHGSTEAAFKTSGFTLSNFNNCHVLLLLNVHHMGFSCSDYFSYSLLLWKKKQTCLGPFGRIWGWKLTLDHGPEASDSSHGPLKTLDTIGNCQRPVFSLAVSQHMHKKQTCENLSLIGHRSCEITMKEKNTLVT